MSKIKLLSLIIPAYKQEKTIVKDIKNINKILASLSFPHELVLVVDGFLDKTYEKIKNQESRIKNLRVLGYQNNKGKGFAIKYGVREARGDIIGFIDAGMDINPATIPLLLDLMQFHDADIVIGSKLHPESKVNYPFTRLILSWGYRTLTKFLFGFVVRDTQVGLKFFKRKVAKEVFSRLIVKQFAFDVEVLTVAKALGFKKIYEGPIELDFTDLSTITSRSFWKVILHMLWDTLAVFYRLKVLHYYEK